MALGGGSLLRFAIFRSDATGPLKAFTRSQVPVPDAEYKWRSMNPRKRFPHYTLFSAINSDKAFDNSHICTFTG